MDYGNNMSQKIGRGMAFCLLGARGILKLYWFKLLKNYNKQVELKKEKGYRGE
jgi:hypothetical protein